MSCLGFFGNWVSAWCCVKFPGVCQIDKRIPLLLGTEENSYSCMEEDEESEEEDQEEDRGKPILALRRKSVIIYVHLFVIFYSHAHENNQSSH